MSAIEQPTGVIGQMIRPLSAIGPPTGSYIHNFFILALSSANYLLKYYYFKKKNSWKQGVEVVYFITAIHVADDIVVHSMNNACS
jgi:hypothetical protein